MKTLNMLRWGVSNSNVSYIALIEGRVLLRYCTFKQFFGFRIVGITFSVTYMKIKLVDQLFSSSLLNI